MNKYTEKDIARYLKKRFCQPEWAFFSQVRSSTGAASSIADGIAVHMYSSRGHEINGFEIKVSRSDWLSELKNSHKAEELFSYCDKWWLVVSDKNIVKDGELPKGWGLMVLQKNGVFIKKQAEFKKHKPIKLSFVASLLRRAVVDNAGMIFREEIGKELDEEFKRGKKSTEYTVERANEKAEKYKKIIETFEEESGIKINEWYGSHSVVETARAIKRILNGEKFDIKWDIEKLESSAKTILEKVTVLKNI